MTYIHKLELAMNNTDLDLLELMELEEDELDELLGF